MTTKQQAWDLFQKGYYDNVDAGNMEAAVKVYHEQLDWSHQQVWVHHNYQRTEPSRFTSPAQILAFLNERKGKLAEAKIRHKVRDMVLDGDKGALLGAVEGSGPDQNFMVWFELKDGKIARYSLRPL
jgi:hypothetical protein